MNRLRASLACLLLAMTSQVSLADDFEVQAEKELASEEAQAAQDRAEQPRESNEAGDSVSKDARTPDETPETKVEEVID